MSTLEEIISSVPKQLFSSLKTLANSILPQLQNLGVITETKNMKLILREVDKNTGAIILNSLNQKSSNLNLFFSPSPEQNYLQGIGPVYIRVHELSEDFYGDDFA